MRSLVLAAVVTASSAWAQYVPNVAALYASNTQAFNSMMSRTADFQRLLDASRALSKDKKKAPAATAKNELKATDFTPAGARTLPQQLAAAAPEKERAQVLELASAIIPSIEAQPEFRKNNVAAAMALLLGAALSVTGEAELSDEAMAALTRGLAETLASSKSWATITPEQRTQAYDAFLLNAGLMLGLATNAQETKDAALAASAKAMGVAALKQFGVAPSKP